MTYTSLYTGGTFDLFHAGHVNFLRQCATIADIVIVSLNTDEFIKEFKGKPPIYTYDERKDLLEACKYVYKVIPNTGGKDSKPAILKAAGIPKIPVYPDVTSVTTLKFIAIGSDWAKKDYYAQMGFTQQWLDDHGLILIYLPYTQGVSTTELKRRILHE